MNKEEMFETLTQKAVELADRLREIESEFNSKKEEFLRVQGALEALQGLSD